MVRPASSASRRGLRGGSAGSNGCRNRTASVSEALPESYRALDLIGLRHL